MDWFSLALTFYGGYKSYQAQGDAENMNQDFIAQQMMISRGQAKFSVSQLEKDTEKLLSSQEVAYAKGGVTGEGSPTVVSRNSQEQAEIEAMAILWGGQVGADTAFFEGKLSRSATRTNQAATLLNSVTQGINIMRTPD